LEDREVAGGKSEKSKENRLWGWEVDATGSGSCISGVEPSRSETREFKWPLRGKEKWEDVRLLAWVGRYNNTINQHRLAPPWRRLQVHDPNN
jgi:hypothetical protein